MKTAIDDSSYPSKESSSRETCIERGTRISVVSEQVVMEDKDGQVPRQVR